MRTFKVIVNGNEYEVAIEELRGETGAFAVPTAAPSSRVQATPAAPAPATKKPAQQEAPTKSGETIVAQMPGTIVDILVKAGEQVTRGQHLLVLEAMKMANQVVAHQDGTVAEITVAPGDLVNTGDVLVILG